MKKKNSISKSKVTRIKPKQSKPSKKRLGMGLSSLLSADKALDSIIRKKTSNIETNSDLDKSVQKVADKIKMVSYNHH